jgi:hypothetical protein
MCWISEWGEVATAVPPSGCFPYTEGLVNLRLLEKRDGGVELESSKDALEALLYIKSVLPFPEDIVVYLGRTDER